MKLHKSLNDTLLCNNFLKMKEIGELFGFELCLLIKLQLKNMFKNFMYVEYGTEMPCHEKLYLNALKK